MPSKIKKFTFGGWIFFTSLVLSNLVVAQTDQITLPDCSDAYASPDCLQPSNHQMVPINILGVTDPDGTPVTIRVIYITSDEPTATDKGSGGKHYAPDASGVGTDTPLLRSERSANGDGRVYVINFVANVEPGVGCIGSVVVHVPKNTSSGCPAVDSGQKYIATEIN